MIIPPDILKVIQFLESTTEKLGRVSNQEELSTFIKDFTSAYLFLYNNPDTMCVLNKLIEEGVDIYNNVAKKGDLEYKKKYLEELNKYLKENSYRVFN